MRQYYKLKNKASTFCFAITIFLYPQYPPLSPVVLAQSHTVISSESKWSNIMTIPILPFLGLLAVASAANPKLLQTRQSTCVNPVSDQELVVRHEYPFKQAATDPHTQFNSNCPKKTTVDGNGNCPIGEYTASSGCVSYCEAKVEWFFGPEVPYSETQCQANSLCTFATAQSITVTNTYELNFGFGVGGGGDEGDLSAAFNLGSSYSYSKAVGTTRTITQPRPSNSLQYCGYWTFLPYYIT